MIKKKNKIFVGISGGVDSSVCAKILKEEGYDVYGVFIRTWTPDFMKCNWQDERRDAMRVCAHLDIPFLECDAIKAYKKEVVEYMVEEYKNGRTPNPDVMCNRQIKFGVFWDFAKSRGADFIATGHYARIMRASQKSKVESYKVNNKNKSKRLYKLDELYKLSTGCDSTKDQSYFLWTLTQEDLSHTLFPIGYLNKSAVRKIALKHKIPTATKKDSQGVCFLGHLDMKDFLKHYIDIKNGDVLNEKGEIIGSHEGAMFFTLGERHGFQINKEIKKDKPLYIINKDIEKNTITVSHQFPTGPTPGECRYDLFKTNFNIKPLINKDYKCQIRYHGEMLDCQIKEINGEKAKILFNKNVLIDKGQSVVFYDDDVCLGGGIVE
jgi:tRNA-uridine 2-sulfurtransferase